MTTGDLIARLVKDDRVHLYDALRSSKEINIVGRGAKERGEIKIVIEKEDCSKLLSTAFSSLEKTNKARAWLIIADETIIDEALAVGETP